MTHSDAFSGMGRKENYIHNERVKEATKYLYEQLIPSFTVNFLENEDITLDCPEKCQLTAKSVYFL
jgi:ribosomal protein S17E